MLSIGTNLDLILNMMKRIKALILLISFISTHAVFGQEKLLSIAQLQEDFKILRYNIEEVHAALYLYTSKDEIDQAFDQAAAQLNRPMTEIEFYRIIAPIQGLIKNGHTQIAPSKEYFDIIKTEKKLLPFSLYHHKGNIFILQNLSQDTSIQVGSIIRELNGENMMQMVEDLAEEMTRDGDNMTFPIERLVRNFNTRYFYSKDQPAFYNLKIEDLSGNIRTIKMEGLPLETIKKNRDFRYGKPVDFWASEDPVYTLAFKDKTAIMTLKTFSKSTIRKRNKKSKQWFKESFATILEKQTEKLIIDLRSNGGGDPEPTIELFSHLYPKSFTFYKSMYTETQKIPNGKLYEDPVFLLNLYTKLKLKKNGERYNVKNVAGLKPYQPAKEQYKGEVIVLIDAFSFSATGEMCAILKEHDRVTFIGEETGGNPNQNTSGMMLQLTLPESQIRAIIPLVVFEMNVNFPNIRKGVIPDIPLQNTVQDELNDFDRVMDFALNYKN